MSTSTENAQNILSNLCDEVKLDTENPSANIKEQYHRVMMMLAEARHQLDLLNDMKEEVG